MNPIRKTIPLFALVILALVASVPAAAQCPNFLCFIDLKSDPLSPLVVCPNDTVYSSVRVDPIAITSFNDTCDPGWLAAVVQVNLPPACTTIDVWVQYEGQPEGWTVNIGDSLTNNGFGGDQGTLPAGENAEAHVLDETLWLYNGGTLPELIDPLVNQHLVLTDGALNFTVRDQFIGMGQPYSTFMTPNTQRLFSLPDDPVAPANRTIYVGLNRVVSPVGDANPSRNGCGARRVLITTR